LDPDFHGKPESFWINGLKNPNWMSRVSDYQGHVRVVYQPWQDFGPAGVPLLVKALKRNRPWDKFYGKVWPKLPSFVGSRLPKPMDDSEVRARAASVLHGMGKDAQMAVPALEEALQDESDRVRQTALAALKVQLPGMGLEKSRLLPMFLKATHDALPGIRNNALLCLGSYENQASVVIPVLLDHAQNDSDAQVRTAAIRALAKVDPKRAREDGTPLLLKLVAEGDKQTQFIASDVIRIIDPEAADKAGIK